MATLHETTPDPSAADPTAALAGLTDRLSVNRLGKSMFREMDRDLLAMRAAADALTALTERDAAALRVHQALAPDWMSIVAMLGGDQSRYDQFIRTIVDAALNLGGSDE
ncbi:hypothetical protein QDA11_gp90 [Microbacterium phage Jayden]|uniref:Uncharacterized protein n=1 Tax=Microbacterium phage Jayden TaxID=2656550 RepID=A0A649VTR0_9CAUD|nr:hypothetical protein QDA11_gp90 [Microbacterium phage Jayden]QGJ95309.1 hypothetical protein PBI_JAYDEN_90 [Microbacterium phage Jayden]